jgi:DHA1 family tetracycline resistance protein-like MFS transporter
LETAARYAANDPRGSAKGTSTVRSNKPAVSFIFITLLLDVLGFGLLIPVAPKLVMHLLNTPDEATAAPYYGFLAATYAVMQFIFSPTLGALSDHFGRRPVLLVAIFGSGLDYFAMALAPSLAFLFITRAINGLSGASMTVCSAYIADVTPPEKRAAGFGMLGAAFGIGFVLGPLMGGVLGNMDTRYPFYAAGGLSILNWLYGLLVLPESLPPERRSRVSLSRVNPVAVMMGITKYPQVVRLAVSMFFLHVAMFGLQATWVLYTSHRYHWTELQTGLSLAFVGIGAAVVQGGLARKIIPALGEKRSLLIGLLIGVAAYAGYGTAPQGWMIYLIVCFASIGGIASPAAQSLITKSVSPTEQGAVQGGLTAIQSVGSIAGFLLAPFVFAWFNGDHAPAVVPGASLYLSALLQGVGLVIAWWALHSRHDPVPAPVAVNENAPAA